MIEEGGDLIAACESFKHACESFKQRWLVIFDILEFTCTWINRKVYSQDSLLIYHNFFGFPVFYKVKR